MPWIRFVVTGHKPEGLNRISNCENDEKSMNVFDPSISLHTFATQQRQVEQADVHDWHCHQQLSQFGTDHLGINISLSWTPIRTHTSPYKTAYGSAIGRNELLAHGQKTGLLMEKTTNLNKWFSSWWFSMHISGFTWAHRKSCYWTDSAVLPYNLFASSMLVSSELLFLVH